MADMPPSRTLEVTASFAVFSNDEKYRAPSCERRVREQHRRVCSAVLGVGEAGRHVPDVREDVDADGLREGFERRLRGCWYCHFC